MAFDVGKMLKEEPCLFNTLKTHSEVSCKETDLMVDDLLHVFKDN